MMNSLHKWCSKHSLMSIVRTSLLIALALLVFKPTAEAQQTKWMNVGALQNFYIDLGNEIEIARNLGQQDGFRWPAIYPFQDSQAAKGLWIGARNVTDEGGNNYGVRVLHVGPRATGQGFFFPVEFKTIAKFATPEVNVDGGISFLEDPGVDEIDPTLGPDKMIKSVVNTTYGLTMERNIMQFSNENHDNYHIIEYIFTNTGNVDGDAEIELPNNTLTDVVVYLQKRLSVNASSRYTIGNATGWGINTMNDRVGDDQGPNYGFDDVIANFSWHGFFPQFTDYNNVGAPIRIPNTTGARLAAADTSGRLVAYQFVGTAKLHADASVSDQTNDPAQPFTMNQVGSDDPITSGNDPFNATKMLQEYNLMTQGRVPRHAYLIEPSGYDGFISPSGDPAQGTSGGFSSGMGYGPYTLAPGESFRFVIAEGQNGIGYEKGREVGIAYKNGEITSREKNIEFFAGRDMLLETFRKAKAALDNDLSVPEPPQPPSVFNINGGGDGIFLDWVYDGDISKVDGFEVYRAAFQRDSTYRLVGDLPASARDFVDDDNTPAGGPIRGIDYYYHIKARGLAADNDGSAMTPAGALKSNQYYTQSYDPARLQRPEGASEDAIRIVPNPYVRSASNQLRFDQVGIDRIAFFDIPGRCIITIYTELGERVKTINHTDGSGDDFWDLFTDARQRIASGVYIAVFENTGDGERRGEKTIKKFVVIL